MALIVTLDMKNVFNSLLWNEVGRALQYYGFPPYLREVLRVYIRDRDIEFPSRGGCTRKRNMRGPQGSVLGLLLWDFAYSDLPCPPALVSSASRGEDWEEARATAELAVACVVRSICALGLRVTPSKCEALYVHDGFHERPPSCNVVVKGTLDPRIRWR